MGNEDLKIIYTTGVAHLAEMLKQILENENIESFIINKQDSSYHFGHIEVYVNSCELEKAKQITEEFEKNIEIE